MSSDETATNPIPVNGPVGELAYLSTNYIVRSWDIRASLGHIDKVDVYGL